MRIRELRIKAELTQIELASKLGLEQASISQWETGKTMPTAALLPKIAGILGCNIDNLFEGGESAKAKI